MQFYDGIIHHTYPEYGHPGVFYQSTMRIRPSCMIILIKQLVELPPIKTEFCEYLMDLITNLVFISKRVSTPGGTKI